MGSRLAPRSGRIGRCGRIALVAFLAIGCAAGAGRGEEGWREAIDWSWLRPGETTEAQVQEKAGEPRARYRMKLLPGRLDLEPTPFTQDPLDVLLAPEGEGADERTVEATVLVYGSGPPADHPDRLVFRGGRLLYAVVLPVPGERTAEDRAGTYGSPDRAFRARVRSGQNVRLYAIEAHSARRLAFARVVRAPEGPSTMRVVWAAPGAIEGEPPEREWRLPPAREETAPPAAEPR